MKIQDFQIWPRALAFYYGSLMNLQCEFLIFPATIACFYTDVTINYFFICPTLILISGTKEYLGQS